MSLVFDPWKEYGLDQEVRLVIWDSEKNEYTKISIIDKQSILTLDDKNLIKNPWQFKYKYQIKKQNRWINFTEYMMLANDHELESFLLNKIKLDNMDSILSWDIKNTSSQRIQSFSGVVTSFMDQLWKERRSSHNNARKFAHYIQKNIGYEPTYLGNIAFYLDFYIQLKELFKKLDFNTKSYDFIFHHIVSNPESQLQNSIENILHDCNKFSSSLQLSHVILGKMESFLGHRKEAIKHFTKSNCFKEDYLMNLRFDQGMYTYNNGKYCGKFNNHINFIYNDDSKSDLVILMSLDVKFLKLYGISLLYAASVLKKYHFHFHIIGDRKEAEESISATISMFHLINNYRGSVSSIIHPTFSTEIVHDVVHDPKTFYACSRFINASYFMDYFDSDIFIMDADMSFLEDPAKYFHSLQKYDVAIPFSVGLVSLCPWRRIMAGNVYLKNNLKGRQFISLVRNYILSNIHKPIAWTLDQNALSYAYENVILSNEEIKIGDCYKYSRPMIQSIIRKQIEAL